MARRHINIYICTHMSKILIVAQHTAAAINSDGSSGVLPGPAGGAFAWPGPARRWPDWSRHRCCYRCCCRCMLLYEITYVYIGVSELVVHPVPPNSKQPCTLTTFRQPKQRLSQTPKFTDSLDSQFLRATNRTRLSIWG